MATTKKLMGTTAVGGGALAIEDVFSTYLYTGTNTIQSIVNGIDLASEGGLVWTKNRDGLAAVLDHQLMDSEQGAFRYVLESNNTDAAFDFGASIITPQANGFDLSVASRVNQIDKTYASWTFRKAPRFFDVVTYTGTGSARTVSHNLGVAPGCIIAKNVSRSEGWRVYHRSQGATKYAMLQSINAFAAASTVWNNTEPTDSVFTTGSDTGTNGAGDTIVAYLFAHEPLGPSGDGSDGLIACGSYTVSGGAASIDLGWEPQFVINKVANDTGAWFMFDNMRGMAVDGVDAYLRPDSSNAENSGSDFIDPTPTGFNIKNLGGSQTFIYIAIRRGPMRQPESGTEVFQPLSEVGTGASRTVDAGFPVDTFFIKDRTGLTGPTAGGNVFYDRLRGNSNLLQTQSTAAEAVSATYTALFNSVQNGVALSVTWSAYGYREYCFRRAPGFFDVVAYTGDGVAGRTVPHNLGVAPELMIVKRRSSASGWNIYHSFNTATKKHYFSTGASFSSSDTWNNTEPSDAVFTLGTNIEVNGSGSTYVAYLFATLPGVSKVGSYTGNGTSQTINCGFTSGARFILIKRTDSTGDWYVWDTARGIVAANDPHLSLNTTAAEVTTDDSVDPDNSGFIVNQVAATNINVSSASYIFYAVS